jgi:putative phage-type endonuclease
MHNYLIQRSEAWFNWRKWHIGSSDAPVIMGVSPWKTPLQLYNEKVNSTISSYGSNYAMQRGVELEPLALALFEAETGYLMTPSVKVHPTHKMLSASLDGLELDGACAVEIKCPGKVDHELALKGIVPEKYIPQLQHIMEVCQLPEMYYMSYVSDSDFIIFKVKKDNDYTERLLQAELEFWQRIQDRNPPQPTDRDSEEIKSEDWVYYSDQYAALHAEEKELLDKLKELESRKEDIKNELIRLADFKSGYGAGIKLSKSIRRGHIDYARVPWPEGLDLEAFRKESKEVWRVSFQKEDNDG